MAAALSAREQRNLSFSDIVGFLIDALIKGSAD